jgi:DnaJ-class molecular chaperone
VYDAPLLFLLRGAFFKGIIMETHKRNRRKEPFWYEKSYGRVCEECGGDGCVMISCCGDNMINQDIDICPTCKEHTGLEEEECGYCQGGGIAILSNDNM